MARNKRKIDGEQREEIHGNTPTRVRTGLYRRIPFGPREVRVILDNFLQASMFFNTTASRPEYCLCPSFKRFWAPRFMCFMDMVEGRGTWHARGKSEVRSSAHYHEGEN